MTQSLYMGATSHHNNNTITITPAEDNLGHNLTNIFIKWLQYQFVSIACLFEYTHLYYLNPLIIVKVVYLNLKKRLAHISDPDGLVGAMEEACK